MSLVIEMFNSYCEFLDTYNAPRDQILNLSQKSIDEISEAVTKEAYASVPNFPSPLTVQTFQLHGYKFHLVPKEQKPILNDKHTTIHR
jgi:hypothetical protein